MSVKRQLLLCMLFMSTMSAQMVLPEWAKDAIWYQIFPERFRNGDARNDPTGADMEYDSSRTWSVSPWTSDWYKLQPWEVAHSGKFYENVFDRRYGGDLQGVLDKLGYLNELGINAIYFNPVFDAYSLHKYDASSYHHIDRHFGPNPSNDAELMKKETDDPSTWHWTSADSLFLRLVHEAHRHGIRVIIDGVFNHSGTRFWAFRDVQKNQQKSPYADWYDVRRWDDPATPENEFTYKGWWDEKSLPEFKEDSNGFMQPVRQYFFNITKRWMDPDGDGNPADGVDGWRLDVANDVSDVFWREWRIHVKKINPKAYIVGEIWDNAAKWLSGDEFDAVMNYPFARACVRYFVNSDAMKFTPSGFDNELAAIRKSYPAATNYVLQNLLDTHDTDRLPSMIMNPNRKYDDNNGLRRNPDYRVEKPTAEVRRIQRLMILFQMTYLGAPMVYYGDEAGMWGADDPDDRKPMVWDDLQYNPEVAHPIPGKTRPTDEVRFDKDLFAFYKRLTLIRQENEALRRGNFRKVLVDDKKNTYGFVRELEGNTVLVVINNSDTLQHSRIKISGSFKDQLTWRKVDSKNGNLDVSLDAKSAMILLKK